MEQRKSYRIAMIGHKRVPGGEGGVEVVVEELSTRMARHGQEVTLYNRGRITEELAHEGYKGCKIVGVPTVKRKSLDALVYGFLATIQAVFHRFDIYHFHAIGPGAMCALTKLFGKRNIVTIHGLDWQRGKWGGFAVRYLKFCEKVIAKTADEIIVLSKGVQQYFWETYHRQTNLIYNGVSIPEKRQPELIKEQFGLEKGKYILFLARIVPEKGLHYLIEAFQNIETDYKLVIAGGDSYSGDYFPKICQIVQGNPNILMTGFVRGQLKDELFSNCALYVLPSDIEGMPISLLEAMAYGAPCLVSDICENTDVLGPFGEKFQHGNVDDLKVKLVQCIQTAPNSGENQIEFVKQHYSWESAVDNTMALYSQCIKARKR